MKKCPKCRWGAVPDQARFCPECGRAFNVFNRIGKGIKAVLTSFVLPKLDVKTPRMILASAEDNLRQMVAKYASTRTTLHYLKANNPERDYSEAESVLAMQLGRITEMQSQIRSLRASVAVLELNKTIDQVAESHAKGSYLPV